MVAPEQVRERPQDQDRSQVQEGAQARPTVSPGGSGLMPGGLLGLQAAAGNHAVGAMLGEGGAILGAGGTPVQRALASPRFSRDAVLASVEAGTATVKQGDTGDPVRKIQHAVHDAGVRFRTFGVDGLFEDETRARVGTYQVREGVGGDTRGEVGAGTIRSLDARFPATAVPATAGDPYSFAEMKTILAAWNRPLLNDLATMRVQMVARLWWADERFDGGSWTPEPMEGAGETTGTSIIIATNNTNEAVAKTVYHEYQHARAPYAYRTRSWEDEESRVYELSTYWEIARGLTPDPGLTTTDPTTGEVTVDPGGVSAHVDTYPGVGGPAVGEVIAKVGANRVRVVLPSGQVTVRAAVAGDTVPGARRTDAPRHVVPAAAWRS